MKSNLHKILIKTSKLCIYGIIIQLSVYTLALAMDGKAQNKSVNEIQIKLDLKTPTKLEEVLESIEKTTEFHFSFRDNQLSNSLYTVSLESQEISLGNLLMNIAKQTDLAFTRINDNIFIKKKEKDVESLIEIIQVSSTVTGTVTDENGEPLPGATIQVKGTSNGTITDMNGTFSINAEEGATLQFSFVGYLMQEILVGVETNFSVQMELDLESLEEVLVIGYGAVKKEDLTGAVARANLEPFKESPNVNIAQSLQGSIPGLNVGQVNSAGTTPPITIRGQTSLGGNSSVLFVVDGIMYTGSITALNPDDIASIDVLKDASATAVYGAQGANGVILITTKRGSRSKKPTITYSTSYTTQTPSENLQPLNREQFIDKIRYLYYDEAFLAPDYTEPNPDFNPAEYLDGTVIDSEGNILDNDFDWWDAATHKGSIMEHKASISGGGETSRYLISVGHTVQKNYIINDNYKRSSIRANIDVDLQDWWTVGVQSFVTFGDYSGAEPEMRGIVRHAPLLVPYDEDGNMIPFPTATILPNPFMTYDVEDYERQNYLFGNFYSEINFPFLKGLSYRINYGNTLRWDRHYYDSEYGAGETGRAYKENTFRYDYTLDNIITYKKIIADRHNITATFMYGATERQYDRTFADATGFSSLTLGYNSLQQSTNQYTTSGAWREALNYQMGRINYEFADRYLLTTTLRRDGFSGFAQNEKWGLFPSAALGWTLSNEGFFDVGFVNFFKLRSGYGAIGNLTERYFSLSRISRGSAYVFGDGGTTQFGQYLTSLPNKDLQWESTAGINLGMDFRLFDNRISGNIEYYNTETKNQLFQRSVPSITGVNEINVNLGNIRNSGVEVSLNTVNIERESFRWESTLNFSRNRNKIVTLTGEDLDEDGEEDDIIADGLFIGQPIGTIYAYEAGSIYQLDDDIPEGYYPGTYSIIDQNGDGLISADSDRVILGYAEPAYRISFLNTFQYKNFTLTVFLNSVQGGKNGYLQGNVPSIGYARDDNSIRFNYFRQIEYWAPNNPDAEYARSITRPAQTPNLYKDRSFVRLQDISLKYRLPKNILNSIGLKDVSVFISGKNLATWTKWKGWDPETGQGLTDNGRPVMKGYSFGLNITL